MRTLSRFVCVSCFEESPILKRLCPLFQPTHIRGGSQGLFHMRHGAAPVCAVLISFILLLESNGCCLKTNSSNWPPACKGHSLGVLGDSAVLGPSTCLSACDLVLFVCNCLPCLCGISQLSLVGPLSFPLLLVPAHSDLKLLPYPILALALF